MANLFKPQAGEFEPFHKTYLDEVGDRNPIDMLRESRGKMLNLLEGLRDETWVFRYAEGKWSVKEVLGHIMDTERIFAYRALRIARGDTTPLPGYDENLFIQSSGFNDRSDLSLLKEYKSLRLSTIDFFETLRPEDLPKMGVANGKNVSVRTLVSIIPGHEIHHYKVLMERYGLK